MTEWPRLMIILVLINTVQWPYSTALQTKDYNSYWDGYLRSSARNRPKRTSFFDQNTTTATTDIIVSSYEEVQKDEPVINPKNMSVTDLPPTNLTKWLFNNENKTNNTNKQQSTDLNLPETKTSSTVVPNSIDEKMQLISTKIFIPEPHVIEKCSMNESFCIEVDNYPRQDVLDLFRTSNYTSTYFGDDTVIIVLPRQTNCDVCVFRDNIPEHDAVEDLETEISNTNFQPFCESRKHVIFPEAGLTIHNEWRYILQVPKNGNTSFKQEIHVDNCENAETTCKFNNYLPPTFKSLCLQKYVYKQLVAISDSKEIYYERFKIPSCCTCMYLID